MANETTVVETEETTNPDNGIPYISGDDNIVNVVIKNPLDVNLETFDTNEHPYVEGDNNIVTITIGDVSYAYTDASIVNNILSLVKANNGGVDTVTLPNVVTSIKTDGSDLLVIQADKTETRYKLPSHYSILAKEIIYTDANTATITFADEQTFTYNITYDSSGSIATIQKGE
jgi:hypothetical protein